LPFVYFRLQIDPPETLLTPSGPRPKRVRPSVLISFHSLENGFSFTAALQDCHFPHLSIFGNERKVEGV
jgi:hypothetical protein